MKIGKLAKCPKSKYLYKKYLDFQHFGNFSIFISRKGHEKIEISKNPYKLLGITYKSSPDSQGKYCSPPEPPETIAPRNASFENWRFPALRFLSKSLLCASASGDWIPQPAMKGAVGVAGNAKKNTRELFFEEENVGKARKHPQTPFPTVLGHSRPPNRSKSLKIHDSGALSADFLGGESEQPWPPL